MMKKENIKEMKPDEIHKVVADDYGRRVSQEPVKGGCCGNAKKSALAGFSGYKPEEIAALPEEAVVNSFGCGNPVALAGIKSGDVVLDLGCGAGIDLLLSARKVGAAGHVIGIDMTDEMIEKARANVVKSGFRNIDVRKGLIEKMPVEDSSVDWIISNCVINLSPEKPKVFAEIARVLKPGGQMLVSDIVGVGLSVEVLENPAFYASCVGGVIPEEDYLAGLRAVGLTDVAVRDRMHYDVDQFYGFATSILDAKAQEKTGACSCGCKMEEDARIRRYASELAGKVWSAKVCARKPC